MITYGSSSGGIEPTSNALRKGASHSFGSRGYAKFLLHDTQQLEVYVDGEHLMDITSAAFLRLGVVQKLRELPDLKEGDFFYLPDLEGDDLNYVHTKHNGIVDSVQRDDEAFIYTLNDGKRITVYFHDVDLDATVGRRMSPLDLRFPLPE